MVIFGCDQHLGPYLKKKVGMTTLPIRCEMSSPPYISLKVTTLAPAGNVVTRLYYG
jgi:hypothetical protein